MRGPHGGGPSGDRGLKSSNVGHAFRLGLSIAEHRALHLNNFPRSQID